MERLGLSLEVSAQPKRGTEEGGETESRISLVPSTPTAARRYGYYLGGEDYWTHERNGGLVPAPMPVLPFCCTHLSLQWVFQ